MHEGEDFGIYHVVATHDEGRRRDDLAGRGSFRTAAALPGAVMSL